MNEVKLIYGGNGFSDTIEVDGVVVGYITAPPCCYINLKTPTGDLQPVARFKYAEPRKKARAWVRLVLAHLTVGQVFDKVKQVSPVELAKQLDTAYNG